MYTLPDRIYFTGFMAAGKTTIGRMVANTLGYDFVDLDQRIELQAGKTVAELFGEDGEEAFRQREVEVLAQLSSLKQCVVSLGGGALSHPDAFAHLGSNRLLIYVRVPPDVLVRRIQFGRSVRPLMLDAGGRSMPRNELMAKVLTMLSEREPQYEQADIVYEGGARSVGITVDRIVNMVRRVGRDGY